MLKVKLILKILLEMGCGNVKLLCKLNRLLSNGSDGLLVLVCCSSSCELEQLENDSLSALVTEGLQQSVRR